MYLQALEIQGLPCFPVVPAGPPLLSHQPYPPVLVARGTQAHHQCLVHLSLPDSQVYLDLRAALEFPVVEYFITLDNFTGKINYETSHNNILCKLEMICYLHLKKDVIFSKAFPT